MTAIVANRNNAINEEPPVLPQYIVKPDLLQLFRTVGAPGRNYFSFSEVKEYLGEYIKSRQLLDPSNGLRIIATNDPLGQVFGREQFHALWALKRLHSYLTPLGTAPDNEIKNGTNQSNSDSDDNILKRKLNTAETSSPNSKRLCPEFYFNVSWPSTKLDSETETIYSVQGYDTVSAKDSEDEFFLNFSDGENNDDDNAVLTDWDNDLAPIDPTEDHQSDYNSLNDDDLVDFEYEVSSLPSDLDSDSAPSVNDAVEFIMQTVETDIEFWADSSNCEDDLPTDEDPDITDRDKWMCKHCKSLNAPTIRYCARCWQVRQNWLPENRPRPPKRLRKKRQRDAKKRANRISSFKVEVQTFNDEPLPGTSSQEMSNETSNSTESLCVMCFDRPCDGCIVHGSTGHMIGCYKCLKTLKHNDKPCPICRAPILKVIRVFKE